ncbi:MAG TPA: 1,4-alpha-glucan branching enzyme, partial [Gammaproteobacteria bacterium]|nr:1,4-alpha-glucan branching enzyme [Gammaproteobacteria bacterium]
MRSAADKDTPVLSVARQRLQDGAAHDPFEVLGLHERADGSREITVFLPPAEAVQLDGVGAMRRISASDFFVLSIDATVVLPLHYSLTWTEKLTGRVHRQVSPYSFAPQISDFDLHLFQEGRHQHAWQFLGARLACIDDVTDMQF